MQMFRNMEVVLMLCFGLIVTVAMLAQPSSREESAGPAMMENAKAQIPVVVITGKRLSDAEKGQLAAKAG
jgi:hypothetical protein